MRNRRVNVYNNTNLNLVVTDYRAGTPLKNTDTRKKFKEGNVVPGGMPSQTSDLDIPLAGTRISRVRGAPIAGYRKTPATDKDGNCCTKDKNTNGFTQEIYQDTWTLCDTDEVCVGDKEGIVARPTRSKKPIIRSGLQYNAAAAPNVLRNTKEIKKKYAFSYAQYQKNLRCLSYERSQEKYKSPESIGHPEKYRKSGCNSCCNCCVIEYNFKPPPPPAPLPTFDPNWEWIASLNGAQWEFVTQIGGVITVVRANGPEPCPSLTTGLTLTFKPRNGPGAPIPADVVVTIFVLSNVVKTIPGKCGTTRGENVTIYKPNNKKFQVQGAVSSGSRLERLKLDTIQGSRIAKRIKQGNCDPFHCNSNSKRFTQGYRSAEPRFVTNPDEGGNKTRGFVPTRWRQAYLARGRAMGNIFQRTSSFNISGALFSKVNLPYPVGSVKSGGCCHPPNAGTTN